MILLPDPQSHEPDHYCTIQQSLNDLHPGESMPHFAFIRKEEAETRGTCTAQLVKPCYTGRLRRIQPRKWRETKLQPSSWPGLALLNCSLFLSIYGAESYLVNLYGWCAVCRTGNPIPFPFHWTHAQQEKRGIHSTIVGS